MATIRVPASQGTIDSGNPGDVFLLDPGQRGRLSLVGLRGTATAQITVLGDGTRISGGSVGVYVDDCRYVKLCDLEITGFANCGVHVRRGTERITLARLEVGPGGDPECAGFRVGSQTDEVPAGWVQHDTRIEHCHVHDVGSTAFYVGKAPSHDGTPLDGLVITQCVIERIGMDGFQIRNCVNADIGYNTAREIGARSIGIENQNGAGLCIGIGAGGRWHHNTVEGANLGALLHQHVDGIEIDHNLFVDCDGSEGGGNLRQLTGAAAQTHHNTFVRGGWVKVKAGAEAGFRDNLLAGVGTVAVGGLAHHNVVATLAEARLDDDYCPTAGSPAIGAASDGGDVGAFGMAGEPEPPPPPPPPPPPVTVYPDKFRVTLVATDIEGQEIVTYAGWVERQER